MSSQCQCHEMPGECAWCRLEARAEKAEADLATCRGMLNRLVGGEEARDLMEASAMVERNAVRRAKEAEAERDEARAELATRTAEWRQAERVFLTSEAEVARLREALRRIMCLDGRDMTWCADQTCGTCDECFARAALAGTSDKWLREFARKCVEAGVRLGLPESTGPRTLEEVVEDVCK